MDTNVNDADDMTAQKVVGARFRAAREAAGLSRAQVERKSNVSAKAIEKFEAGVQSPNFVRFAALCEAIGKTVDEILNGTSAPSTRNAPRPAPQPQDADRDDDATEDDEDPIADALSQLDDMRAEGFHNGQRKARALVQDLKGMLQALEPGELLALARDRSIDRATCPSSSDLLTALVGDDDTGQAACGDVEERIIDTAVLGVDLNGVDADALTAVAEKLKDRFGLEPKGWFGWGDQGQLVAMLRDPLRQLAFAGKALPLPTARNAPARA